MSFEVFSSRTKTKRSKDSTETAELLRNNSSASKQTNNINSNQQKSKLEDLEDVLQHFGSWHPFFVVTHLNVFIAIWLCYLARTLAGELLVEITQPFSTDVLCRCDAPSYRIFHEDPDNELIADDVHSLITAAQWGFYVAHLTLFLSQSYGRRGLYIPSLISISIMLFIIGFFHQQGDLVKFSFMILHFGIHHMRVNLLVNSIEWMPSEGRLLTTALVFSAQAIGQMTIYSLVFFEVRYYLMFHIIGFMLLVLVVPIAYFALHDSPYYVLSINDIYGLQFCFEMLESFKCGSSPMPAEEMVDDVAFSVYERHETFVDTLWDSVSNWRIFKEFIIFIVLITALTTIEATSTVDETLTYNYYWDGLTLHSINSLLELVAYIFAYLCTGQRRGLTLIWLLLIFLVSISIIKCLPANQFDICNAEFGRTGAVAVIYQILSGLNKMVETAFEMMFTLHLLESFPTTIRPQVYGILFTLRQGFLKPKIEEIFKRIPTMIPSVPNLGIYAFCFIALIVLIINEMGQHRPMRTYFADLNERKKHSRDKIAPLAPLISTTVKKMN